MNYKTALAIVALLACFAFPAVAGHEVVVASPPASVQHYTIPGQTIQVETPATQVDVVVPQPQVVITQEPQIIVDQPQVMVAEYRDRATFKIPLLVRIVLTRRYRKRLREASYEMHIPRRDRVFLDGCKVW